MSKGEEKRILSCSPTISLKPKRYECRVPDRLRSHLILYVKVVIMDSIARIGLQRPPSDRVDRRCTCIDQLSVSTVLNTD